jgi:hypothetical protein
MSSIQSPTYQKIFNKIIDKNPNIPNFDTTKILKAFIGITKKYFEKNKSKK